MARSFHARFLDLSSQLADGGVLEGSLKVCVHDAGDVYWELRRLMLLRAKAGTKLMIHKELKRHRAFWATEFEFFGCHDGAILDSFNAVKRRMDVDALRSPLLREEYQISTAAMLVLMILWHRTAREKCVKDRARALWDGFVAASGWQC